jgi:hypothetical protein
MALVRVEGAGVPTSFPLGDNGVAVVSAFSLSLTFQFLAATVHVDEEVFDAESGLLTHTVRQLPTTTEDGRVWLLKAGRYRAYGLSDCLMGASTELLTPRESSTCTVQTTMPGRVKIEPSLETIYELSDDDVPVNVEDDPILPPSQPNPQTSANSCPKPTSQHPTPLSVSPKQSVVECLKLLCTRKGSRNIFKKCDYNSTSIKRVEFLPPQYNGDVIFEFPPLGSSSGSNKAKQLRGMDKHYDGHVWTRTHTSNIVNDFGLIFRTSSCCGHLRCENVDCDYLTRVHRTTAVNETEWDGVSSFVFDVGTNPPRDSTLVCKCCKVPPSCLATCDAKIYYVLGKNSMTRAYVHFGTHDHPVKVGAYREDIAVGESLVEEHVHRIPSATKSAIVLEAT